MALTKREIDGAKYDPEGTSWQWLQDEEVPGFGVRLLPSGRKSFVLRYRTRAGRRRYLTVGPYGTYTVAQARDQARVELAKALQGEDPAEERQEARKGKTFGEFADTYLRRMEKRWAERTRYEYERQIEKYLKPEFGPRGLTDVKRSDVAALLDRIGEESGPYLSNRVHSLVRAMYNRAAKWGFVPDDLPNPARRIDRFKERPKERWLREEEVETLIGEVRKQPDPFFRAFVPLLLLTGMRKSELLRARWEHIDFGRGEMLIPETKAGKPQTRKLSPPAVEILRFLPREEDNPHVFPGRMEGTHRRDFYNEWREVREAANLDDVTIHDLRRTAGSYMAQAGVPLQVIGDVLGHQSTAITKVYARLSEENERDALDTLGAKLGGLMKLGQGGGS